ncbi:MAG: hypothetical protein ACREML_14185 [Vulcanimicrobiaceae bacterium]
MGIVPRTLTVLVLVAVLASAAPAQTMAATAAGPNADTGREFRHHPHLRLTWRTNASLRCGCRARRSRGSRASFLSRVPFVVVPPIVNQVKAIAVGWATSPDAGTTVKSLRLETLFAGFSVSR